MTFLGIAEIWLNIVVLTLTPVFRLVIYTPSLSPRYFTQSMYKISYIAYAELCLSGTAFSITALNKKKMPKVRFWRRGLVKCKISQIVEEKESYLPTINAFVHPPKKKSCSILT